MLAIIFAACQLDKPDPLPEGPTCTVRLIVERERIGEEDTPMSGVKSSPNDLYAVQIYQLGTQNYGKYAYGIFTNPENMEIDLPVDGTYRIEISLVSDGAAVIAKGINGGYLEPFTTGGIGRGPGKVTDRFGIGSLSYMSKLNTGYAVSNGLDGAANGYDRPPVSRFYGMVDNFTPGNNASLTVELKWVSFGLTVVPQNFDEGSIEIAMDGAPKLTVTPDNSTTITKRIFTFDHSDKDTEDWRMDNYSESIPTQITWIKSDGTRIVLRSESNPITFKRKYNKQLTINCGAGDNSKVTISKEDETLIDGDSETIACP